MSDSGLEYIRKYYDVPADIGRRVICSGKPGIIVGSHGPHIRVLLDENKPGRDGCYHPTWEVIYGDMGTIRLMTRSQLNYQRWLDSDCGYSFREWMGFKNKRAAGAPCEV